MRICNLVSGIMSVPSDSRQSWVVQKPWGTGAHKSPSVLLKASLQPGVSGGQQELLTTKVKRTSSQWNKLLTVFKWDGLVPGWVTLSFPQALPDLSKGLILKVEMGGEKKLNIQRCSLAPLCISNVESKTARTCKLSRIYVSLDTQDPGCAWTDLCSYLMATL